MIVPHLQSAPDRYSRLLPPASVASSEMVENGLRRLTFAMRGFPQKRVGIDAPGKAGYTYFGQLIAHDLSLDESPLSQATADLSQLVNRRTPRLDLDTLYGKGPWHPDSAAIYEREIYFLLAPGGFDFWNDGQHLIIADHRSTENLILRQLLAAFAKLHNLAVDQLRSLYSSNVELFAAARERVVWQYQYLIRHEWLPQMVDSEIYKKICLRGERSLSWEQFSIPVEFSHAAMRFGHSLVRPSYFMRVDALAHNATLEKIFARSHDCLPMEPKWQIEWTEFFGGRAMTFLPLNTFLTPALVDAHVAPEPLPTMTLLRGSRTQVAGGQAVAEFFGETPLTWDEMFGQVEPALNDQGEILAEAGLADEIPLWYYVLREAAIQQNGNRLGRLASHLITETIEGALRSDPDSIVCSPIFHLPVWAGIDRSIGSLAALLRYIKQQNYSSRS